MIKSIINNNNGNVKQEEVASVIRFGEIGRSYYMLPKAFMNFKWALRYNRLTWKQISLLESLFAYWGDDGVFPSLNTIGNHFGIDRTEISKVLSVFNGDRITKKGKPIKGKNLLCPVCNESFRILSIQKRQAEAGTNLSNTYNLSFILGFFSHVLNHTKEELKMARDSYLESNKDWKDDSEF
jgi:hypothetical protein